MRSRIEAVRAAARACESQAFYVRNLSNIAWITGFEGVFDGEAAHALLVLPDAVMLHTDSRYIEACRKAAAGTGIEVDAERASHPKWAVDQVVSHGVEALAVESDMSLFEFRELQRAVIARCGNLPSVSSSMPANGSVALKETSRVIVNVRAVKDEGEIARMRAAQAITDAAFSHIVGFMKPGMTEREVQIELEDFMRRNGAEDLAFSSIVATGANGASPHAIPGDTRIEAGQCVVMDFGARAMGYCSDMTRMVFAGEPDARMVAAYETLRKANESVEAALRPGVTGAQMHELAESVLEAGGFGGKMGHGLGHGVGIDIHEEPCLSPRYTDPLEQGNVVTVEPGIYLPGEFGMRLEDFGVITADGFCKFTQSTHELVII